MMTSIKLACCAGVALMAAATGWQPPPATKTPTPASAQPAAPRQLSEQDCREAMEKIREVRREIRGIEGRLDNAQKALNAAKGEGRLDECVKIINQIADDEKLIRQKTMSTEALQQGHVLEHIRAAKDFADLQHDLNRCPLVLYLERVSKNIEDSETPGPAKK